MFCSKCGKEIFDEAVVCPYCGCSTNTNLKTENAASFTPESETSKSPGIAKKVIGVVIGVILVLIGIIQILNAAGVL